jgi:hypothetical protein
VKLIYLDTNIWNVLAQQASDEEKLCRDLTLADAQITLGLNAFYEMMRTFYGTRSDAYDRGKRLFTCLRKFLAQRVPLLKTWEEMLTEEAENVSASAYSISPIEQDRNFISTIRMATKEMSSGYLRPELEQIVKKRQAVNEAVGQQAATNARSQPEMNAWLKSVQADQIMAFLDRESVGEMGRELLSKYSKTVLEQFKKKSLLRPLELASALLSSARNKTSHAVVRNDMYRGWDFANRSQSNFRSCIPDDSYHVANAGYCQFFVTEDRDGQAEAARHAVSNIRVLLYEREKANIAEWLPQTISAVT